MRAPGSLLLLATLYSVAGAQTTDTTAPPPAADPADVATTHAIVTALYHVISGPAGQARDWDRFRSLFHPDAKLIPVGRPQNALRARALLMTVEEYVARSGPLLTERGFFEREIGNVTERFENIAHVFSTYDSRWTPDGDVFQRGINSIQLMWDGDRWWVVNIMWHGVPPDFELPAKYLSETQERQ